MGYRRLLTEGEEVVVDVRPHWWYLAGPVAVLAVVIAGAVAALVLSAPDAARWVTVAALGIAAAWLLGRYVRWATTRLILTTSRIVERRGVIGRTGREIPISALSDIGYRQSLFERIIGTGDLVVESSARNGREVFPDLPHPADIKNRIYAQMEHWQRSVTSTGVQPSIPEQIDQLDRLRRRGVISDAEFDAKKTELLHRL